MPPLPLHQRMLYRRITVKHRLFAYMREEGDLFNVATASQSGSRAVAARSNWAARRRR